ncbi:MAG: recombinase family protein [Acidobacteria bacterium]|nr:recombinase family protein [Acidobacteriota bacterium]
MKVALYARVSTKRQERAGTIASQIEALRKHAASQGYEIAEEFVCLDDGVSGASLQRRGLDRLRDGAEAGRFDAALVLSPDRLSRKYAYLILILEEFQRLGVQVLFLEQPPADDPHTSLLVQIQGAVAEYERAKLAERYRRGKLHRARQGEVWWTSVPLGYRHVPRRDGVPPHVVIDQEKAEVIREIFHWHADEGITIRQIAKRLTLAGVVPSQGGRAWGESTIHRILRSEAYLGTLYYNRTQTISVIGENAESRGRSPRIHILTRPKAEWISLAIPPIIDHATFERSQSRHGPNRQFSPRRLKKERWLLRRLLRCAKCGRKYACVSDAKRPDLVRRYYYRCGKSADFSGAPRCRPCHVRAEPLDELVWNEIRQHLLDPRLILKVHTQLKEARPLDGDLLACQIQATEKRMRQAEAERRRLLDAFQAGFVRQEEFEERAHCLSERLAGIERDLRGLQEERRTCLEGKDILTRIENFTTEIAAKLNTMNFHERQLLTRTVLEEAVLDGSHVHLYFKIPLPRSPKDPPETSEAHHGKNVSSQFDLRSRRDESVNVGMKIQELSRCLDREDSSRHRISREWGPEVCLERIPRTETQTGQKVSVKLEKDSQHFWDRECNVNMRHRLQDLVAAELTPEDRALCGT